MKPVKLTCILPVFVWCFISFGNVYSQPAAVPSELKATFCGKAGTSKADSITVDELKECNWKILLTDPSYSITSFKMSLVPKDYKNQKYEEYEMSGDSIGEKYRSDVLNSRTIFLEFIHASNKAGESKMASPIGLRIKESRKIYPK
jgi:hypothetical protein